MSHRSDYTLAKLRQLHEELELEYVLQQISHEHHWRKILGDDLFEFLHGLA